MGRKSRYKKFEQMSLGAYTLDDGNLVLGGLEGPDGGLLSPGDLMRRMIEANGPIPLHYLFINLHKEDCPDCGDNIYDSKCAAKDVRSVIWNKDHFEIVHGDPANPRFLGSVSANKPSGEDMEVAADIARELGAEE